MPTHFTTVGLIGKYGDASVGEMLQRVAQHLHARGLRVLIDENTAASVKDWPAELCSRLAIGEQADLAIVIGGDGTLLNAARSLADHDVPLLGVNLGRLGFLVDVSPHRVTECLDEVLAGRYQEESRLLLHAVIERGGEPISASDALNDVVVHKWEVARMLELEVYIEDQFVYTMRADGLIVSTPTGSTAYALSGGGPILHPALDALVLVPICPHSMSNRPIVVAADSRIEIVVKDGSQAHAQVTCDGQINLGLLAGDRVKVAKKSHAIRLLHPATHNHYDILRAKLRWSERL
ncbi:NAD(+) kinase [Ectothiorhodospiraceae bacterium 2226]|nr:NAD(+) kinase [Ectothiorhodospiraceae bacterium 2226]